MTDELHRRFDGLEKRLEQLENERAIRDTIARYGCAVDAGSGRLAAQTFVPDGVYDSDFGRLETTDAIEGFIDGTDRIHRLHRTAHLVGPLLIRFEDDAHRAVAAGYSVVFSGSDDTPSLDRVSINRWDMERHDGLWACAVRTLRPVGHPEAPELLASVINPSGTPAASDATRP